MSRFFPALLILACSGDSLDRDTAPGPPTCPVLEGFVVKGDAIPGRIVEVEAQGSIEGTELRWTVSSGYAEGSGNTATWSLDPELAIYASEQATIEATASLAGCDNAHYSETLEINYPDAHRVLLITNPTVADSLSVAEHYAAFRPVPDENICAIATAAETTLDGADLSDFTMALGDCLDTVGPHIQILLPVFGVPYKVTDRIDDIAANDSVPTTSLDALLFLGRAADQASAAIYNPLYQDSSSMEGSYAPYQPLGDLLPEAEDSMGVPLFLVTRIDGVDAEAAMALVDRAEEAQALAQTGELDGTVYVDGKSGDTEPTSDDFGTYESGEWNMWGTRQIFEDLAFYDVVWDGNEAEFGTKPAPTECPDALYYAGWYSYNHYNDAFTWAPGAIGGHLDSCSACDIRESTSWSASALQRGITATFGAVGEPYVAGMPEYDQFYLYLLQGGSYAEAAYESTVIGLWMMTWLGDPLYRPYPGGVLD